MKKNYIIDFKFRAKPWTVVSGGQNFTETHVLTDNNEATLLEWAKKNLKMYFDGGYDYLGMQIS